MDTCRRTRSTYQECKFLSRVGSSVRKIAATVRPQVVRQSAPSSARTTRPAEMAADSMSSQARSSPSDTKSSRSSNFKNEAIGPDGNGAPRPVLPMTNREIPGLFTMLSFPLQKGNTVRPWVNNRALILDIGRMATFDQCRITKINDPLIPYDGIGDSACRPGIVIKLFVLRLQQIATCHRRFNAIQASLYEAQCLKPHLNLFRQHPRPSVVDVPQPVPLVPAQLLPADIVCHRQHPHSPARRMPDMGRVVNFGRMKLASMCPDEDRKND